MLRVRVRSCGCDWISWVRVESRDPRPLVKLGCMEEMKVAVKCRRLAVVPVC